MESGSTKGAALPLQDAEAQLLRELRHATHLMMQEQERLVKSHLQRLLESRQPPAEDAAAGSGSAASPPPQPAPMPAVVSPRLEQEQEPEPEAQRRTLRPSDSNILDGARQSWAATFDGIPSEAEQKKSCGGLLPNVQCVQRTVQLYEWWSGIREPVRSGPLARVVLSSKFEMLTLVMIMLNGALIIWQTDANAKTAAAEPHRLHDGVRLTSARLLNVSSSYFALASWKNKYFRTLDLSGGSPTCQSTLRSYDYTRVPKNADAIFDTPVAELFVDFFLAFPEAKVLLTTRPGADWAAQRVQKDFGMASPLPVQEPCGKFVRSFSKNLTELAAFYDLNNQFVRCLVPAERLFEVNLWEDPPGQMRSLVRRLGEFLGRPAAEGLQMPKHLKFAKMDENPDWPGNACDSASAQPEPLALAEGRAQESLWTERFGGMMQTLARQECDIVL